MVGRERRRKALAFRGTLQNVNVSLRGSSGVLDWPELILDCCLCLCDGRFFCILPSTSSYFFSYAYSSSSAPILQYSIRISVTISSR